MAITTFVTVAGVDDQQVTAQSNTSYADVSSGTIGRNSTNATASTRRELDGSTYRVFATLYRWDTSAIGGDALLSAAFRPYITGVISNADSRNLVGEWYTWDGVSASDWSLNSTANAFSIPLAGLVDGFNEIPLSNIGNISTSGSTYLRVHVDGGEPTGLNRIAIRSFEHTGLTPPGLIVEHGAASPESLHERIGGVTDTQATVASKFANTTSARLAVSTSSTLSGAIFSSAVSPDVNGIAKATVTGLAAGTEYYYGWELDGTLGSQLGTFKTLVVGESNFSFAFASCAKVGSNHAVFPAIAARKPLLFLHTGDAHYSDIAADDQALFRSAHDSLLTQPNQRALWGDCAVEYVHDDHDYGPNDSDRTSPSRLASLAVYRQYVPSWPLVESEAIYRAQTIGRVRFILTDCRSHRDPKTTVDSTSKTMLGTAQKTWLKDELVRPEPVKVIVSSVTWGGSALADSDAWRGYSTERQEIADYCVANGIRPYILGGDMHGLGADDGSNTSGYGGFPVVVAAALDHPTHNIKGGPYSHGTNAGEGQYGWVAVTDTGTSITLDYTGSNDLGTTLVSLSTTYTIPADTTPPAPPTGLTAVRSVA